MSERKDNQGSTLSVAYNNAGQPLSYGDQHFKYINGQIAEVYRLVAGREQVIAQYQYNEVGQRISKTVFEDVNKQRLAQPETRYFVYEGSLLLHELNAEGRITRHYVYMGEQLVATVDYAGRGRALQQDEPSVWNKVKQMVRGTIAGDRQPEAVWHYVLTDHLGRPRLVVDEQQKTNWRFVATAFGGTGHAVNTVAGQALYEMPIRFKGQYADAETQLYYNGWRYYDPATGRFTTPDPLGLKGGENLYGYVNQQPVQYDDPQGLLLFSFDGTGNKDYWEIGTEAQTNAFMKDHPGDDQRNSNVVRFRDVYAQQPDDPLLTNNHHWDGMVANATFDNQPKDATKFSNSKFVDGFYIAGAGTEDQYTNMGSNNMVLGGLDNGVGTSLNNRVDQMLDYFSQYLKAEVKYQTQRKDAIASKNMVEVPIKTIDIDVTGFSRGAASARMFASKLEHLIKGEITPSNWRGLTQADLNKSNICVKFRFLGLWDTVPALGPVISNDMKETADEHMELTVSNAFKYVAHAVAVNEDRGGFAVRSIFHDADAAKTNIDRTDGNIRVEKGFLGAHSDIGGGYAEGDLSNVALMWMIDEAKKAGIEFDNKKITDRAYDVVKNPVVHDSVGTLHAGSSTVGLALVLMPPTREFMWANDDGKNMTQMSTGGTTAGTMYSLDLDWEDTLKFQAAGSTKFEEIKSLSAEYDKSKITCSPVSIDRCDPLEKYYALKSVGMDKTGKQGEKGDDQVILYSLDPLLNEAIQVQKYLDWIKANYGTSLKTTFKAGTQ